MIEIHPISPSLPVVKPKKINRDDQAPPRQQHDSKPTPEQQEPDPVQHIDEIV